MLFLQGTRDTLATWDLIESICSTLPKAKLVKIDGADHSFKAGKINTMEILTKATGDWIEKIIGKLKLVSIGVNSSLPMLSAGLFS